MTIISKHYIVFKMKKALKEKDDKIANVIWSLSEKYLKETLNASEELDKKSTVFLSVFMSLATALLILLTKLITEERSITFIILTAVIVIGFYIASYYFAKCLKPNSIYLVGNLPKPLIDDYEKNSREDYSYYEYVKNQVADYQTRIEFNRKQNSAKAAHITTGLRIVQVTMLIAFIFPTLPHLNKLLCLNSQALL